MSKTRLRVIEGGFVVEDPYLEALIRQDQAVYRREYVREANGWVPLKRVDGTTADIRLIPGRGTGS